jgi:putative transposase
MDVLILSHQPVILPDMQIRYRYRLHPTPTQRQALARSFGCARAVYNDGLRLREDLYRVGRPYVGDAELSRRVITLAKRTPERAWLGEVSAVVLQQSLADLDRAYRNYFRAIRELKAARARGEKAKLKIHKPRFKSKHHEQAVRFTRNSRFRVTQGGRLSLSKVGGPPGLLVPSATSPAKLGDRHPGQRGPLPCLVRRGRAEGILAGHHRRRGRH